MIIELLLISRVVFVGWKYGWGRDPGEKCVARRKYLEAAEGGH